MLGLERKNKKVKKKFKVIGIVSIIGIVSLLSIWMYIRPEELGNINQSYSEPETSISKITFLGETGEKIRFSFSSNIKNGNLDIIVYDSKGNAILELADADKLVEFLELKYSDTYTLAAERNDFVGSFKITIYKEGVVKLPAWIL